MDDLVQNPEAQKLAQMLQQQQMQKYLQMLQGVGANAGAMSELDRQQMQRPQPVPMLGQPIPQGDFPPPAPMFGQPVPQGGLGGRPVPMPSANNPTGVTAQEYEMMRKMYGNR